MRLTVDLIRALAALLWPILGFVILVVFRNQIRELFQRIKRGKILGQEFELDASLKELNVSAVAAAKEVGRLPPAGSAEDIIEICEPEGEEEILNLAAASPKTALVALSRMVEGEARDVLASLGDLKGRTYVPLDEAIGEISDRLPRHIPGSLNQFYAVRNRIVHGHGSTDDDVLSAIDSGITILRALRAIPREVNVVYHPGVPIYSDHEARSALPNVKGVILETTSPGGARKNRRIFPTTKDYFEKGQRVSWEWSFERKWGKAWYRDPDTSELKEAWHSSAEFIGRPLD